MELFKSEKKNAPSSFSCWYWVYCSSLEDPLPFIWIFFILIYEVASLTYLLLVIAHGFGSSISCFIKNGCLRRVGMAFVGFFIKSIGEFIHIGWMMIAKVLGWINSRIFWVALYYVILTLVALLPVFGKSRIENCYIHLYCNHCHKRRSATSW